MGHLFQRFIEGRKHGGEQLDKLLEKQLRVLRPEIVCNGVSVTYMSVTVCVPGVRGGQRRASASAYVELELLMVLGCCVRLGIQSLSSTKATRAASSPACLKKAKVKSSVVHAWNPSTQEVEAGGLEIEVKVILDLYMASLRQAWDARDLSQKQISKHS